MLDANYFRAELSLPYEKRTMVREYCPVTCDYCGTVTSASSTSKTKPEELLKEILEHDAEFRELTKEYDLSKDPEDAIERHQLLESSRKEVKEHNALYESGQSTYKMSVNKFSVMKPDELAPLALSLPPPTPLADIPPIMRRKRQTDNSTVDYRQYMQPVANQLDCGGCWAFSMAAALEGFFALKNYDIPTLSVQQLLDCDRATSSEYGVSNLGCDGGYFQVAAEYLKIKGLTSDMAYPFSGESSTTCQLSSPSASPKMKRFDAGYVIPNNATIAAALDKAMEERVRKGPVAVGMAVNTNIYSYSEGIYDGLCGATINHAVVIVGFTPEYWIVRNSWGASWGESGHIRILRHNGDPCKLTRYWAQPTEIVSPTQGPTGPGNAIVVNTDATDTESTTKDCCDGQCCDWCDCEDEDDDDDFFTTEREDSLDTTTQTTAEVTSRTIPLQTTSQTTKAPLKTTKKSWRWEIPDKWYHGRS
ncbi:unnamed protein product [Cylicocyclus nassatus]|uniref:Uncharacterized protein n=1 Tax=Cylicocyclus nassatus TaxID=53992 RepID=A0AA36H6R9_CYLNA|nr:unnamed protein product [Cylicocyclus nassatus]